MYFHKNIKLCKWITLGPPSEIHYKIIFVIKSTCNSIKNIIHLLHKTICLLHVLIPGDQTPIVGGLRTSHLCEHWSNQHTFIQTGCDQRNSLQVETPFSAFFCQEYIYMYNISMHNVSNMGLYNKKYYEFKAKTRKKLFKVFFFERCSLITVTVCANKFS